MEVRPAGRPIDTSEVQPKKPQSLIAVTLLGTSTWPCASGVYRQPASTPPSASSSKVTGRIAVVPVGNWASGFSSQSDKTIQWPNACGSCVKNLNGFGAPFWRRDGVLKSQTPGELRGISQEQAVRFSRGENQGH